MLRWGVLSTAKIAVTKVIPALQASADLEVRAVASRRLADAERVAGDLAIPRAYGSYAALLADDDIDAVYIPLPNHLHAAWVHKSAAAGKHVLCEKPLALTAAEARAMVAACEQAGVLLMEAFMYRLHPLWVRAVELVRDGAIGEPVAVHTWFSYFNDDPANIRNQVAAGGGALYDIGCYAVNLARLLFDDEPDRVAAHIDRDGADGVDVLTSGLLGFPGGRHATFTVGTRAYGDQWVRVQGTEGVLGLPVPFNIDPTRASQLTLASGPGLPGAGTPQVLTCPPADPYTVQGEAFAAAVRDGHAPPIPTEDAVATLEVIEALRAAGGLPPAPAGA